MKSRLVFFISLFPVLCFGQESEAQVCHPLWSMDVKDNGTGLVSDAAQSATSMMSKKLFVPWEGIEIEIGVGVLVKNMPVDECLVAAHRKEDWVTGCELSIIEYNPARDETGKAVRHLVVGGELISYSLVNDNDFLVLREGKSIGSVVSWDGRDDRGALVAEGYYRVQADCVLMERAARLKGVRYPKGKKPIQTAMLRSANFIQVKIARTDAEKAEEEVHKGVACRHDPECLAEHFELALHLSPQSVRLAMTLLGTYYQLGRKDNAERVLEHCRKWKLDCRPRRTL